MFYFVIALVIARLISENFPASVRSQLRWAPSESRVMHWEPPAPWHKGKTWKDVEVTLAFKDITLNYIYYIIFFMLYYILLYDIMLYCIVLCYVLRTLLVFVWFHLDVSEHRDEFQGEG